jgi:hypothetical protein
MPSLTVRKGDAVNYRDPVQSSVIHRATCMGHGRKYGEPIVHLDDGHWLYMHQVIGTIKVRERRHRKRSSAD